MALAAGVAAEGGGGEGGVDALAGLGVDYADKSDKLGAQEVAGVSVS